MTKNETIILTKIQFSLQTVTSHSVQDDMQIEIRNDLIADSVVAGFSLFLAGRKTITEETTKNHRVPATIWEELKADWAPEWFKRRWPIRYAIVGVTHHVVNHYRCCPHLDLPSDALSHIQYLNGLEAKPMSEEGV